MPFDDGGRRWPMSVQCSGQPALEQVSIIGSHRNAFRDAALVSNRFRTLEALLKVGRANDD
jgi:hypothetical protein